MNLVQVVVLALTQGLTEFIPISSSGHLVVVRWLLKIPDVQGAAFDSFLHLGTLVAVLVYYGQVWWGIVRGLLVGDESGLKERQLAARLAVATVPAAVVGYMLQGGAAEVWRTPLIVAAGLLVTAGALVLGDYLARSSPPRERAGFKDATLIGLAQVLALVPGVSRSGVTIAAGRWRGLSRRQAVNFSFLLSAPIIAGVGFNGLGQLLGSGGLAWSHLLVGFVVSLVSGMIAIHILLRVIEKVSLLPFAVYLVVLSAVVFWL